MSNITTDQINTIQILNIILSSISIFSSLFVFVIFWFFKEIRTFPFELVIWLLISTTLDNISFYLNFNRELDANQINCIVQGFIQITCDNSTLIWATIIAYTAYRSVVDYDNLQINSGCLRKVYLIIGFIFPVFLASIAYSVGVIGPSGAWCWLATRDLSTKVTVSVWISYSLMWLLILINTYYVLRVIEMLRKNHLSSNITLK